MYCLDGLLLLSCQIIIFQACNSSWITHLSSLTILTTASPSVETYESKALSCLPTFFTSLQLIDMRILHSLIVQSLIFRTEASLRLPFPAPKGKEIAEIWRDSSVRLKLHAHPWKKHRTQSS